MIENERAYLMEEVGHVRDTYARWSQDIWDAQKFLLVTTGAIWSWCAVHVDNPGTAVIMWIPFVLSIFVWTRARATWSMMLVARQYLLDREASVLGASGWEHFSLDKEDKGRITAHRGLYKSTVIATGAAASGSSAYAVIGPSVYAWCVTIGVGLAVGVLLYIGVSRLVPVAQDRLTTEMGATTTSEFGE